MSRRRGLLVLLAAVFMHACGSADQRCGEINLARMLAPFEREQRTEERNRVYNAFNRLTPDSQAKLSAAVSLEGIREEAARSVNLTPRNLAERYQLFWTHDTLLPQLRPPPRPSELAWYAEHCYEGKPRGPL